MTRQEFTAKIAELITEMVKAGDRPVEDWGLRNALVQKDLFDKGLSKCDGVIKKSAHQFGIAKDIYLSDEKGNVIYDTDKPENAAYKKRMLYWHSVWDKMLGGDRRITWDDPHFEG